MDSIMDMEQICRTCMRNEVELLHIYGNKEVDVPQLLTALTSQRVEHADALPQRICASCLESLQRACQFKNTCEQSYSRLVRMLHENPLAACESNLCTEKCTQTEDSSIYPCERCSEKYFTYDALRAHREQAHKGSAMVCRFCSKRFNRIGYLKTHMAIFHPEAGYNSHNQCQLCKRQFTRREHMRRHLAVIHKIVELTEEGSSDETFTTKKTTKLRTSKDEHSDKPNSEEESLKQAESDTENEGHGENEIEEDDEDEKPLANLLGAPPTNAFVEVLLDTTSVNQKHEGTACDSDEIKCEPLLSPLARKEDVLSPVKRRRGRPRLKGNSNTKLASSCEETFTEPASLTEHTLPQINVSNFSCKICSQIFSNRAQLKSHMRRLHPVSEHNKCEECNQSFTHIAQYKRHLATKHPGKDHKCELCEKSFTTRNYLQRHMAIHGSKRYICKECTQCYTTKEDLTRHIKAEGHDKPLLCPECGLRCKTNNLLTVHMRRHNGEKPFKCKFCSKGFPRMDDLRIHEKYHTGEKSHFCNTCGKGFQRKYNLTIHLRVHTGEKPYKCPHCPQAFAQGNDLKAHIRRHTGERFRCEVCGAAFLQGYQIRQHKLTEHGIKEEAPTKRVAKFTSREEQQQQIRENKEREMSNTATADASTSENMPDFMHI